MALLAAAPALAQSDKIQWTESSELARTPMMTIHPPGRITINLDVVTSIRVTKGDLGVDISAQEVFDALVR